MSGASVEDEDYDVLGMLPSIAHVQDRINSRYDDLFHYDKSGDRSIHVCSVCDEFLFHAKDLNWYPVEKLRARRDLLSWDAVVLDCTASEEVKAAYTFNDADQILTDSSWLAGVALSPRGRIGKKNQRHTCKYGFSCCSTCKDALEKKYTPFYAVVNNNHVGHAPACIKELDEVELCMITPVSGYGYCHAYTGGNNKNLKSTMTFLRVEEKKQKKGMMMMNGVMSTARAAEESIARAAVHLEVMGLAQHVVVLITGKMTAHQRKRAQRKIRTDKILRAVEWLTTKHARWKNLNLDDYRKELEGRTPVIIDKSTEVEGENANVEARELFACYFPEGAMDENKGGFDNMDAFKAYVSDMEKKNFDVNLKLQLERRFTKESDGDILIGACLMQFPYGTSGINSLRVKKDNSLTDEPDRDAFLKHLTRLSLPEFHHPMFQLMVYSLICKTKLLRRSRLQVRGKHSAKLLANGLNARDVSSAIRRRRAGSRHAGTNATKTLLSAVDACSQALPHTNEAARQARSTGEALQHHFGIGSIFLTVTFDDENSLLMQYMAQTIYDDDRPTEELNDDLLAYRALKRSEIRLNFPGLSAINFEMLFDILCEEVIGWDKRRNCSTGKAGLFGMCEALAIAFEEQGRKTVHAHMTLWIKGFRDLRRCSFFGEGAQKAAADAILAQYYERIATTALFDYPYKKLAKAFDHECIVDIWDGRMLPIAPDDQSLRDMRHKKNFEQTEGRFVHCHHCGKEFTYEQLVNRLIREVADMDGAPIPNQDAVDEEKSREVIPKARMLAKLIDFKKTRNVDVEETPTLLINATYQHHVSCHVGNCFKCNKQKTKKKHTCGPTCECRYRLPDRSRRESLVKTLASDLPWYAWNGSQIVQPIVDFLPKRNKYDLFQNVSCKAISESKFACNSNLSIITDGPLSQYKYKYQMKQTRDDDTKEYAEVESAIKSLNGRTHDEDRHEAIRLICRAAFAHNKKNIIGAPMASFLTRHGSRFYFSHDFVFCPIKDLIRVLNSQGVDAVARYTADGNMYFENQALHYLCRPKEFEEYSSKQFFETLYVVQVGDKRGRKRSRNKDTWPFQEDTGFFQHPSAVKTEDGKFKPCKQGVKERDDEAFVKVSQWMFPDTAKFKGNILSCPIEEIGLDMETYAQNVLTLLLPHRSIEDFIPFDRSDSKRYTRRLREINLEDIQRLADGETPLIFNDANDRFLQNIQDCAHNSTRHKLGNDDLASCTVPYKQKDTLEDDDDPHDDDDDEEDAEVPYEMFIENLEDVDTTDKDPTFLPQCMAGFSFKALCHGGRDACGMDDRFKAPILKEGEGTQENDFVVYQQTANVSSNNTDGTRQFARRQKHSLKKVVEVLLESSVPRARKDVFVYNPDAVVPDANGSIKSIREWGKAALLDEVQERAFECIVAAFVLTFFDNEDDDCVDATIDHKTRARFRRARRNLMKLKGGSTTTIQLILLLHGPGGSGKSTVITLVVEYSKEYCHMMGHTFTSRTIVITAMSGVAATLLHGETTHSALALNSKKGPSTDDIADWEDTRLVIVDEVSFASEGDFNNMYRHAQLLSTKIFQPYGGLNFVFGGDFSQLEPPGRNPIYDTPCPAFHNTLNAFIELNGTHRFRDDPVWGERLRRFREGEPTLHDIDFINENCLAVGGHQPPPSLQAATYRNRERDAINTCVFNNFIEDNATEGDTFYGATLILMDDLMMQDSSKTFVPINSNAVKKHFWSSCGEDSLDFGTGHSRRVDPTLKLYPSAPMMFTKNEDVLNGQANGSRLFVKKINVKYGETPFRLLLDCGTTIRAFCVSQIESITVRHEQPDILPREFNVMPENFTFNVKLKLQGEEVIARMKGTQFPLISNSCTTGHKLQGYTAKSLFVNEWYYGQNWPYVVLSRVRTMAGLYIRKPLERLVEKFAMPQAMKDMLADFRRTISVPFIDEAIYDEMIRHEGLN